MFLVVVRQQMLPGLVLRSLYEVTRDTLRAMWHGDAGTRSSFSSTNGAMSLAMMLRDKKGADEEWGAEHDKTRLVSDGANLAIELLEAGDSVMPQLMELVFNVWVDKLLYASTRCSRESHARQLSRGGELTTIVWILAEHAGPFQIGQPADQNDKKQGDKKDGGSLKPMKPLEKKKQEEELVTASVPWPGSAAGAPFYPGHYSGQTMYPPQQMSDQEMPASLDEIGRRYGDDETKGRRQRTRRRYITLYPVD
jgi:hypothetical protein